MENHKKRSLQGRREAALYLTLTRVVVVAIPEHFRLLVTVLFLPVSPVCGSLKPVEMLLMSLLSWCIELFDSLGNRHGLRSHQAQNFAGVAGS